MLLLCHLASKSPAVLLGSDSPLTLSAQLSLKLCNLLAACCQFVLQPLDKQNQQFFGQWCMCTVSSLQPCGSPLLAMSTIYEWQSLACLHAASSALQLACCIQRSLEMPQTTASKAHHSIAQHSAAQHGIAFQSMAQQSAAQQGTQSITQTFSSLYQ